MGHSFTNAEGIHLFVYKTKFVASRYAEYKAETEVLLQKCKADRITPLYLKIEGKGEFVVSAEVGDKRKSEPLQFYNLKVTGTPFTFGDWDVVGYSMVTSASGDRAKATTLHHRVDSGLLENSDEKNCFVTGQNLAKRDYFVVRQRETGRDHTVDFESIENLLNVRANTLVHLHAFLSKIDSCWGLHLFEQQVKMAEDRLNYALITSANAESNLANDSKPSKPSISVLEALAMACEFNQENDFLSTASARAMKCPSSASGVRFSELFWGAKSTILDLKKSGSFEPLKLERAQELVQAWLSHLSDVESERSLTSLQSKVHRMLSGNIAERPCEESFVHLLPYVAQKGESLCCDCSDSELHHANM